MLRIPYESGLPMFTAFDIGVDDYTAVWFFQCFRNEIRLLRFEQWRNVGLLDVVQEISKMPYIFGTMFLPWDADMREKSTAKTPAMLVEDLGFEVEVVPRTSLLGGIGRVREVFSQFFFDEINCAEGIDCLENYTKKVNPKTMEFMETPLHNEYSHGADAMRYLAQAYDPYLAEQFIANRTKVERGQRHNVKRST